MKTRFFFAGLVCLSVLSCSKDEIVSTTEETNKTTEPVKSSTDTVIIDTIYYYYLDGQARQVNQITETDDQVWVIHLNSNGLPVCDVFSDDAGFLSWWTTHGASISEVDYFEACMEIRDYAIENDINLDYEDEEDLSNYPTDFQEYVLERIPDYYGPSNKKGGDQVTGALLNTLNDGTNFSGAQRVYTKVQGNYGTFRNRAESATLVSGNTMSCDWQWFGGQKRYLWGTPFGQYQDLNVFSNWNNRADSHF